jgi:urease subunit beta
VNNIYGKKETSFTKKKKTRTTPSSRRTSTKREVGRALIPGEYVLSKDPVICNENRKTIKVSVSNRGDRPCQIGSHTHFFEVNRALDFPREETFGYRLNIPAGTSVRFEPGDTKEVELCEIGGSRICFGFNGLTMGSLNSSIMRNAALEKARTLGFRGAGEKRR